MRASSSDPLWQQSSPEKTGLPCAASKAFRSSFCMKRWHKFLTVSEVRLFWIRNVNRSLSEKLQGDAPSGTERPRALHLQNLIPAGPGIPALRAGC